MANEAYYSDKLTSDGEHDTILAVKDLVKYYKAPKKTHATLPAFLRHRGAHHSDSGQFVRAVDGISFTIKRSEVFALVGESGCGKTTTARVVAGLIEPTSGEMNFMGKNLLKLKGSEVRDIRRNMQVVFQDPYASLDPRMNVSRIIAEPLKAYGYSREEQKRRANELLEEIGLRAEDGNKYPREFSGGQRQRIAIARALALNPKLVIADEPVSALDVSNRAQILNLLLDLKRKRDLSILLIAHDLSVVRHVADSVAVMHLGKIAEYSDVEQFFGETLHPYSRALLDAVPIPDPSIKRTRTVVQGELPNPINPPSGCRFHTRCPKVFDPCSKIEPELFEYRPGHFVACHLWNPVSTKPASISSRDPLVDKKDTTD